MNKPHVFLALLVMFCVSFCTIALAATPITLSDKDPSYMNARYGFSFSLPPGEYTSTEAENSDGVTIKDGKGFTLLAYGTRSYVVLEKTLQDALQEITNELDSVSDKQVHADKKMFEVTGLKGGNLLHIKCIFKDDHARILRITHGQSAHEMYKELCTTAQRTFH